MIFLLMSTGAAEYFYIIHYSLVFQKDPDNLVWKKLQQPGHFWQQTTQIRLESKSFFSKLLHFIFSFRKNS